MNIELEKTSLIDVLQNINDITLIERVKNFVLHEIEPITINDNQKKELDKRLLNHKNNSNEGLEAFQFLDNLKS